MELQPADFLDEFGGKWDGHSREVHGLIERGDQVYKVEILRKSRSEALVSVFRDGHVAFSQASAKPLEALRGFWGEM